MISFSTSPLLQVKLIFAGPAFSRKNTPSLVVDVAHATCPSGRRQVGWAWFVFIFEAPPALSSRLPSTPTPSDGLPSGHLHHSCLYIYPRGYSSKVGYKYNWKKDDIITVVACPFVLSPAHPVIIATSPRSASRISLGRLSARCSLSYNRSVSPLRGVRLSKKHTDQRRIL